MTRIEKMQKLENLAKLKADYIEQATAPLDGMWLTGFVPMAKHFGIYEKDNLLGYFCVNDDGYLLQYNLDPKHRSRSSELFQSLLDAENAEVGAIKGAFCSTAEPGFLSNCLDCFSSFKVNALMYQVSGQIEPGNESFELIKLSENSLDDVVNFSHEAIGAPVEWLRGYYSNLISRKELYAHFVEGKIVATGECRKFDSHQSQYADIGVIVSKNERSKGLATKVLMALRTLAEKQNLMPICSTEFENIGAQKAIAKAGFCSTNRIVQFDKN